MITRHLPAGVSLWMRGVSLKTVQSIGGLELAQAGVGSSLTSPAWPWPGDRMVQQLCLHNTASGA